MALQFSTTLRNGWLDYIETLLGPGALIRLYDGTPPANVAAAITGTMLIQMALAADWAATASGGAKTLSGTPLVYTVAATGIVTHFRLLTAGGVAHIQGTVTISGGGGDITMDDTIIGAGQSLTVTSLLINSLGA